MVVGEAYYPSMNVNEMYRLQPTLANLLSTFTLVLLSALGIAEWIGYAFLLWYVSRLSLGPGVFLTFIALAFAGLITGAAFPPILRHQTYYSTLLLKRGTI